jgi:phospho-N-acetylmuramoyl-pentapeptide-transferase
VRGDLRRLHRVPLVHAFPAQVFMATRDRSPSGARSARCDPAEERVPARIIGGVFVAETISVILQRSVFKYRRRRYGLEYAQQHRVFLRAPLHHHSR